jgi:FAD:protein FMN transferase
MKLFFLLILSSSAWASDLQCKTATEMGTPFQICVYSEKDKSFEVQTDLSKAFSLLRKIDSWMSEWRPSTELSKINLAAGAQSVKVSKELFDIIDYSLQVSKDTRGAFDPTFNALWGLYNFKKGHEREPTDEELKERLSLIDYSQVELNKTNQTVQLKKPGMKLGLGGIGQGYGVDRIVEFLKSRGYKSGFVDGSGDTSFFGKKPDSELWKVSVRNPLNKEKNLLTIYGTDFAVTTSGDDEKFFMKDGRRVHHIIDPKTGRPCENSRQVTVIAKNATEADAFDTSFFVLGLEETKKIARKRGLGFVFVTPDGKTTVSENLKVSKTKWGDVFIWHND